MFAAINGSGVSQYEWSGLGMIGNAQRNVQRTASRVTPSSVAMSLYLPSTHIPPEYT